MDTGNEPPVPAEPDPTTPGPNGDAEPPYWHRTRNGSGRFQRDLQTVRRDAAVAEYLADHPGTTYKQLAELFNFGHRKDAHNAVLRAKADVARPAISKLIGDESEELDALYTEACAILQRRHVTVSHGKVIMWRNPETGDDEPLQDDGPKLAAIRVALDVRKAYQDLHGLKQPAKVEHSGGVKYEVVGIDPGDIV